MALVVAIQYGARGIAAHPRCAHLVNHVAAGRQGGIEPSYRAEAAKAKHPERLIGHIFDHRLLVATEAEVDPEHGLTKSIRVPFVQTDAVVDVWQAFTESHESKG